MFDETQFKSVLVTRNLNSGMEMLCVCRRANNMPLKETTGMQYKMQLISYTSWYFIFIIFNGIYTTYVLIKTLPVLIETLRNIVDWATLLQAGKSRVRFPMRLLEFSVTSGLVVRVPGYRSRGSGFDSRRYQIFWEVVGLERGPLSLMSTIEELLATPV
jgi:hypothetical protein